MLKRTHLILGLLVAALTVLFTYLCILRHDAFFSYEWEDLSWTNGFIWNISQGNWDRIKNYYLSSSYTAIHVLWFNYLMAPVYSLLPDIKTLFFIDSFAICSSLIPLYMIAKEKLGEKTGLILTLILALYIPKYNLIFLDGDPTIYTLPLLTWLFYFGMKEKIIWFCVFCLLIGICRTETPFTFALCAFYFFLNSSEGKIKKAFLLTGISGALWFAGNLYLYYKQNQVNPNIDIISSSPIVHSSLAKINFSNLRPFFLIFWPLLFIPLLSPVTLLSLPSVLMALVSLEMVVQRSHYLVTALAFAQIGLIMGLEKLKIPRKILLSALFVSNILCLVGPNILGSYYPEHEADKISDRRFINVTNMFDPLIYRKDPGDMMALELLKKIPDAARVSATGHFLPHLSSRKVLYEVLDTNNDFYNVDYILIHRKNMYFGAGHYLYDENFLNSVIERLKIDPMWEVLYGKDDFFLFKRK